MFKRLTRFLAALRPGRRRFEREPIDELRAHIDHRADDLERAGLSRPEAHRRARVEFGAVEAVRDQIRTSRPLGRLRRSAGAAMSDLAIAARRLRQAPAFTVFAVITLGLGIGVATAAYSGMYAFALRPRAFDTRGVVLLNQTTARDPTDAVPITWVDFEDLRSQQRSAPPLAAWTGLSGVPLTSPSQSNLAGIELVTGNYFQTLGVRPALGRMLQPTDDIPGAAPVAVLADSAWRVQFDADPDVVGTVSRIGGVAVEIVGVAPPGFRGVTSAAVGINAAWVPVSLGPALSPRFESFRDPARRAGPAFRAFGRVRPPATIEAATAEVRTISARLDTTTPLPRYQSADPAVAALPRTRNWSLISLDESSASFSASEAGRMVLALPVLVLLVACTNLANLFLSRSTTRRQEIAVRAALGASRAQLVRLEMSEAALVGAAGGLVGGLVAHGVMTWAMGVLGEPLAVLTPQLTLLWRIEPMFFAATGAGALLSMVVAGLIPALHLTRSHVGRALTVDTMASLPRWRGRSNLIALQVGVSVALFLITAVSVRFVVKPPDDRNLVPTAGFERLAVATVPFGRLGIDEARARETLDTIVAAVRTAPGVDAASIVSGLPDFRFVRGGAAAAFLTTPEKPFDADPTGRGVRAGLVSASPDAFATVGVPLVAGRLFGVGDVAGAPRVIVLSEGLAAQLFESGPAVGRLVLVSAEADAATAAWTTVEATVIGVVGNVGGGPDPWNRRRAVWMPFAQQYVPTMGVFARSKDEDARSIVTVLSDAMRRADPDVAALAIGRADIIVNGPLVFLRFIATSAGSLGTLALALAMAGLYGVLSHVVSRRRREMGLRIALGADRARILRLIFRGGFRPVLEGIFIGYGVAWVLRQLVQVGFTGSLSAIDVAMVSSAAVPMLGAAAIACYLPARRAARVDPNVALKDL
jgi:predicted permease